MYNKDNKKSLNGKAIADSKDYLHIDFDPEKAPQIEEARANKYGLDLSNLDYIKFQRENLEAEVIGGVNMLVPTKLQILLKISRRPQQSCNDVYRNNVDLYNDAHTKHFIKEASVKLKMDAVKIADFVYDLTERMESFRKDKSIFKEETFTINAPQPKEAKQIDAILKSKSIMEELKSLFAQTGVPDSKLALQLFVMSLSSKGRDMMHVILQGSPSITNEVIQSFSSVLPEETGRFKTSISDSVLYYSPTKNYWMNKVLLLPSLDTLGKKNNALMELITQGMVDRLVTENTEKGTYRAETRRVNGKLSLISATAMGFHELFHNENVLALPIQNPKELKDAMVTREIRLHAGMIDEDKQEHARKQLQHLFRSLKAVKVKNTHLDQVELEQFFDKDLSKISLFLRLTNLITLLHQKQLGVEMNDKELQVEVKPQHMLIALELFQELWIKEEQELFFNVARTLEAIKSQLQQDHKKDHKEAEFVVKEMRAKLKVSPSSFARHINTLFDYGKIERTGGNKRDGYTYKVVSWNDSNHAAKNYQALIDQLNSL